MVQSSYGLKSVHHYNTVEKGTATESPLLSPVEKVASIAQVLEYSDRKESKSSRPNPFSLELSRLSLWISYVLGEL